MKNLDLINKIDYNSYRKSINAERLLNNPIKININDITFGKGKGYLNAGLRWSIAKNLLFEFNFNNITRNTKAEYTDRVGKSRLASNKYKQADEFNKSYDSVAQAAAEKQFDDDVMDKAASKRAKKEKLGKQASKLSQEDEDRYERIKNGLEKLKKKGDEESIKRMKAILAKKDVQKLIKAKGRKESSFM